MKNAAITNEAPPLPPVKPGNEECCRSGCDICVFDLYEQAMDRYRLALQLWDEQINSKLGVARKYI